MIGSVGIPEGVSSGVRGVSSGQMTPGSCGQGEITGVRQSEKPGIRSDRPGVWQPPFGMTVTVGQLPPFGRTENEGLPPDSRVLVVGHPLDGRVGQGWF